MSSQVEEKEEKAEDSVAKATELQQKDDQIQSLQTQLEETQQTHFDALGHDAQTGDHEETPLVRRPAELVFQFGDGALRGRHRTRARHPVRLVRGTRKVLLRGAYARRAPHRARGGRL